MTTLEKKEIEALKAANLASATQINETLSVPSTRYVCYTSFSKFREFRSFIM